MWTAKRAESDLRRVVVVRIAVVERRASPAEYQERLEVSLEQYVDVDPLTEVATVTDVTRNRIESVRRLGNAALNCEPSVEVSQVIDARQSSLDLLLDVVRAEVAVLIEELGDVWSNSISRSQTGKQCGSGNCAAGFRSFEVRAI